MAELLYFGKLTDVTGTPSETLSLPAAVQDTGALRRWLCEREGWADALSDSSVRVAVNSEIVTDPHPVRDGDEIAFLPPVGGG